MGITACIIFGLMGAWIARSLQVRAGTGGFKAVLIIGLIGGFLGLVGVAIGWGDLTSFNLYNVFLSIIVSSILTVAWAKIQPKPQLANEEK
jgi:uncharacterized membrane protein YeaQ/YmgE (transglycosylase-associated protein family)